MHDNIVFDIVEYSQTDKQKSDGEIRFTLTANDKPVLSLLTGYYYHELQDAEHNRLFPIYNFYLDRNATAKEILAFLIPVYIGIFQIADGFYMEMNSFVCSLHPGVERK